MALRTTSTRARAVWTAVGLSLAACSGGQRSGEPSAGPAVPTPPTTETTTEPTSAPTTPAASAPTTTPGLSLDLPATWSSYDLAPSGTVTAHAGAASLPAGLDLLAVAAALQGATTLGVGPVDGAGRADTVFVTPMGADVEPPGVEVSEILRGRLEAEGVTDLSVEATTVAGVAAARATFRQLDGAGRAQQATTVYLPGATASYLVAFSRPVPATGASMIDAILQTASVN